MFVGFLKGYIGTAIKIGGIILFLMWWGADWSPTVDLPYGLAVPGWISVGLIVLGAYLKYVSTHTVTRR